MFTAEKKSLPTSIAVTITKIIQRKHKIKNFQLGRSTAESFYAFP